jgi:hypothetical protein
LIFLVFSAFLDIAWLSVYGGYLNDYINATKWVNSAQIRLNGLLSFTYYASILLLFVKVGSVYVVYNLYIEMVGQRGYSGLAQDDSLTEGSSLTGDDGRHRPSAAAATPGPVAASPAAAGSAAPSGFGSGGLDSYNNI